MAEQRARELALAPVDSLVALIDEPVEVEVRTLTGGDYRLKTYAFWDMDPWESALYVRVKSTGTGLRFLDRYYTVEERGPENDFAASPEQEITGFPTWTEWFACLGCAAVLLIPLAGLGLLISRLV